MELYVPMAFDGTVDKDNILMLYTHDGIQTLGWFDLNTFAKLTDYNPPSYPDNEREKYSSLPYFAAKTLMEWDNYALVSVCKDRKKYVLLYDTVQKVEITALANAKDQIYIVCGGYVIWETGVGALRFFKLPE